NPMHIVAGRIKPGDQTVSDAKAKQLKNYRLAHGDVVMGRRGEMGRCAIVLDVEVGMLCGTGSLFVRPVADEFTSLFLASMLSNASMKRHLEGLSQGVTMPNLNRTMIEKLRVPMPPLDLQHRFARIVESVERQKARLRGHLADLDALFASLQHRAFRGEL
ncbi:MAG: restriction endonuclease subunit S, partial [Verrucomicrobiae bacterium]|nr:restriction endonuclease subunit S [Verrucomicrobiae bacterium]